MLTRLLVIASAAAGLVLAVDETFPRKEFDQRISQYLGVRKKAVAGIPALKAKAEPEQIHAHQVSFAKAIRAARPDAKAGDIFVPAVTQSIKKIVASEVKGKAGKPAKEAAKEGNPAVEGKPVAVKVNGVYPDSAPLSTVPPTLLARLPELPKELEYRFVGKHLVLRDTGASLIVDFIPNALP